MAKKRSSKKANKYIKRKAKKSVERKFQQSNIIKGRTVAETIGQIPIEDIGKFTTSYTDLKKLEDMVRKLRTGYKARLRDFEKKGLYSYAADMAEKRMGIDPRTPAQIVKDIMKGASTDAEQAQARARIRNTLISEFAKYQQFFQQKTSTVSGIKEVNAQQSRQIQGLTSGSTLSQDELTEFWSLYDDFKELADRNNPYRSVESQHAVYEVMFHNDKNLDAQLIKSGEVPDYLSYEPGSKLYMIYKAQYLLEQERSRIETQAAEEANRDVTTLSRGFGNTNSGRFS